MSLGFAICAYCLNAQNTRYNQAAQHKEESALLISGMDMSAVEMIYSLRLAIAEISCCVFALAVAGLTGTFSLMGLGFVLAITWVFWKLTLKRMER